MHLTDEQLRIIRLALNSQSSFADSEEKEKINQILAKIEKYILKEETDWYTN